MGERQVCVPDGVTAKPFSLFSSGASDRLILHKRDMRSDQGNSDRKGFISSASDISEIVPSASRQQRSSDIKPPLNLFRKY
jgi:hypothetical protein